MKKTKFPSPIAFIPALVLAVAAFSRTANAASYPEYGIGVTMGSEATYGNAVSFHWRLYEYGEVNAGVGYNSSGAKLGVGHTFIVNITRSIGLTFGNALVYSGGRDGEVEVDAEFTPEGSDKTEELTAVKTYELGPAGLLGFSAGGFIDYFRYFRFSAQLCYNFAFWGNEVELGERISYDQDVEVTNESQFNEEFDREAKDIVRAGGFGASMGVAVVF